MGEAPAVAPKEINPAGGPEGANGNGQEQKNRLIDKAKDRARNFGKSLKERFGSNTSSSEQKLKDVAAGAGLVDKAAVSQNDKDINTATAAFRDQLQNLSPEDFAKRPLTQEPSGNSAHEYSMWLREQPREVKVKDGKVTINPDSISATETPKQPATETPNDKASDVDLSRSVVGKIQDRLQQRWDKRAAGPRTNPSQQTETPIDQPTKPDSPAVAQYKKDLNAMLKDYGGKIPKKGKDLSEFQERRAAARDTLRESNEAAKLKADGIVRPDGFIEGPDRVGFTPPIENNTDTASTDKPATTPDPYNRMQTMSNSELADEGDNPTAKRILAEPAGQSTPASEAMRRELMQQAKLEDLQKLAQEGNEIARAELLRREKNPKGPDFNTNYHPDKEDSSPEAVAKEPTHAENLKGLGVDLAGETGKTLLEAMNADPESAKGVMEQVTKAQDLQNQMRDIFKNAGIPFNEKGGLDFALGQVATLYKDELDAATARGEDAANVEKRSKIWTILKALLLATGVSAAIALGAVVVPTTALASSTKR